jgi:quinol monooxygenase YgiN
VTGHPHSFVTLTRFVTDASHRDELLDLLREVVALDKTEPGTLVQTVQTSQDDPNEIWLYELWSSPEALDEHRRNGEQLRSRIFPLATEEVRVIICTPLFGHGLDLEAITQSAPQA